MGLSIIDYIIVLIYLVGTVGYGVYLGRRIKTGHDYFLAGRKLPWWAIGMSLVVTDIGAIDIVGIAGSAYLYGIVMGNFDWLGSVPVMIIAAFIFIPIFWRTGVTTVPEWFGRRYNIAVRTTSALIWGSFLACNLGIMLYATAVMLNVLLDLNPKTVIVSPAETAAVTEVLNVVAGKKYDSVRLDTVDDTITMAVEHRPNLLLIDEASPLKDEIIGRLKDLPPGKEVPVVLFRMGENLEQLAERAADVARPPAWPLFYSIVLMGVAVGLYTYSGGLTAVVYTDVIQCIVMMLGCAFVLIYGIHRLGGFGEFVDLIHQLGDRTKDHFHLVLPADTPTPYPWSGIFLGLGLVLANAYWIGNQAIVQRSLGARSEAEAKASYVWGAILKVFIPFIMVVPGMVALAYNPYVADADKAMATLVRDLLPTGVLGIFFAAFLAALMSSVDSCLNSAATLWTKDIYQRFFKPHADDTHYLTVGRILTFAFIVWAILFAEFSANFESIYTLIQTLLTLFQGPSLAIIVLGVLWKRATGIGAFVGLIGGLCCSSGMLFINSYASEPLFLIQDPFLYIAWWSFVFAVVLTVVVSLITPMEPEEKLRGLVYRYKGGNA
ncbi:MAG TPA: sodium/solute symporter [bacterium]|nr:sodium/solute symporter [bacterium]HQL63799.1 sodium/solute symporter [bacterium]